MAPRLWGPRGCGRATGRAAQEGFPREAAAGSTGPASGAAATAGGCATGFAGPGAGAGAFAWRLSSITFALAACRPRGKRFR